MKKILLVLVLAVGVFLSGCTLKPYQMGHNSAVAESLIKTAQKNSDTHSFGGFTGKSTFGDVFAKVGSNKSVSAQVHGNVELLGYPASAVCYFYGGSGKLPLSRMEFTVYPGSEENKQETKQDLLTKLDTQLGAHNQDNHYIERYTWENSGLKIEFNWLKNSDPESISEYARISAEASDDAADGIPGTPGFFPCQIGTDVYTANKNIKPRDNDKTDLYFKDSGWSITMWFKQDETGEIRLCHGEYFIPVKVMGFEESLDFYESVADSLEAFLGAPKARGYGIPSVSIANNEVQMRSWKPGSGGQGLSLKNIMDSGKKYYWFDVDWPGIDFCALYGDGPVSSETKGTRLEVKYNEEYFAAAK